MIITEKSRKVLRDINIILKRNKMTVNHLYLYIKISYSCGH